VVLASFICLCVLDGAAYTFGAFLHPLIEEMEGGRGQTSIAGSLLVATYAFTGPLASRLVTKFEPVLLYLWPHHEEGGKAILGAGTTSKCK